MQSVPYYTFEVNENDSIGKTITTIVATDADEDDLAFALIAGNDAGRFAIDAKTGELRLYDVLDFESQASYELVVEVSDGELTDVELLTINVTDGNDAPVFLPHRIDSRNFSALDKGFAVTARKLESGTLGDARIENVSVADHLLGVVGSTGGPAVQLGMDAAVGISEELIVRFDEPVAAARLDIVRLFIDEGNGGEQGRWQAYFGDTLVDESTFQADHAHQVMVRVTTAEPFDRLVLSATPYAAGQSNSTDSSDYLIRAIEYELADAVNASTFAFTVSQSEPVGTNLGVLAAVDANGDAVEFALVQGDNTGKFSVGTEDGSVTIADQLTKFDVGNRTLTVAVSDGELTDIVHLNIVVTEPPPTKFFVVDARNGGYRYDAFGNSVGEFAVEGHAFSRGATSTANGDPLWVVKSDKRVYVYDTDDDSLLGTWRAKGPHWARGIATDGDDVWIVDAKHDKVFQFTAAADRTSGYQWADDYFHLHRSNRSPSGIVFQDGVFWITDNRNHSVFVYGEHGDFLGRWKLDHENRSPSGITVDPVGKHLWVTDQQDSAIYYYRDAALRRGGQQLATSTIELADNNSRPQGIADPTFPYTIGQVSSGELLQVGQVDQYGFMATTGQRLYFDLQQSSVRLVFGRWSRPPARRSLPRVYPITFQPN